MCTFIYTLTHTKLVAATALTQLAEDHTLTWIVRWYCVVPRWK